MSRSSRSLVAVLCLALLCVAAGARAATVVTSIALDDVAVRRGVTADIHLAVHQRAGSRCNGATVLLIPGAFAAGASLGALADALLEDDQHGRAVCRAITLDLPAHGDSGLPVGAVFGTLSIDDYAATVLAVLARLDRQGLRPMTLVGHSMGGGIIQRMQQRLLDRGSNLRDLGVRHAILLAPGIPQGSPWAARDLGVGVALLAPFHVVDAILGDVISIPPPFWVPLSFSRPDGTIPESAPTMEELMAMNAIGPESWDVLAGTFGLGAGHPLIVSRGAFAERRGTRLDVVAFSQDILVGAADAAALMPYLSGDGCHAGRGGFTLIDTPDAVHAMPASAPEDMLEILGDDVSWP